MQSSAQPRPGFTLSYQGRKLDEVLESKEKGLARLKQNFGQMGALVIRYHTGHGQRAGLLQQIAREDYAENPVEKAASGKDQEDLFAIPAGSSVARTVTRTLEKFAHYTLGHGKVLNDRAQSLIHVNTKKFRGEEALWDIMHSPVWSTGINFGFQLNRNNFLYVIFPENVSSETYEQVTQELAENHFKIEEGGRVTLNSGMILETESLAQISVDIQPDQTFQKNGLTVTAKEKSASVGWILHQTQRHIVDPMYTENILRVMRIAKGGFYELTKPQQALLQSGFLQNNGSALFTQNKAFNALEVILAYLEREFHFDSSVLLSDLALRNSHKRATDAAVESEIIEDFLTGYLITEMVQPLAQTKPESTREPLPKSFTNPFVVIANNAKAIAYAYSFKTRDGKAVLNFDEEKQLLPPKNPLIDIGIQGDLVDPALTNPKHISSLLSAAILVSEQIILEQLLRDACRYGNEHPNAQAMLAILKKSACENSEQQLNQLKKLCEVAPFDEFGPILGLQFEYCDPLIAELRKVLGISVSGTIVESIKKRIWLSEVSLAELAQKLYETETNHTETLLKALETDIHLQHKLETLFFVGTVLQNIPGISVRQEGSRGINAGLQLVIKKLAPRLYQRLSKEGKIEQPLKFLQDSQNQILISLSDAAAVCPFLGGKPEEAPERPLKKKEVSYGNIFRRAAPVIVAGAAIASCVVYNNFRS